MKNRVKNLLIASAVLTCVGLSADSTFAQDRYKKGYTYFSILTTKMNYTSNYTSSGGGILNDGDKVKTDATSTNPVYVTGGLYPFNDSFDVSTEVSTTLTPQRAKETSKVNGSKAMTNYSDMLSNNIQLLCHYKITDAHRIVFGGTYNFSSYKRYKFVQANGVNLNLGVTEQRSTSIALQTGYWYEGYYDSKVHINFRALVGYGAWVHTENTDSDKTFNNNGGYNGDLYLSVGYELFTDKELGLLTGYSIQHRVGASSGHVHLPENTTTNLYLGVYVAF